MCLVFYLQNHFFGAIFSLICTELYIQFEVTTLLIHNFKLLLSWSLRVYKSIVAHLPNILQFVDEIEDGFSIFMPTLSLHATGEDFVDDDFEKMQHDCCIEILNLDIYLVI